MHAWLCRPHFPGGWQRVFSIALADDAGEVKLGVGDYPWLALLPFEFIHVVFSVIHGAALTRVCRRAVLLAAIPLYSMFSGYFPFPLGLSTAILVAACPLPTFLSTYPLFPLLVATTLWSLLSSFGQNPADSFLRRVPT